MKYALLALFFLALGYGLGLFISPSDVGLPDIEETAANLKQHIVGSEEIDSTVTDVAVPSPQYPEGSYLTESDLLSIPGKTKPLGFRVGPPIKASAADDLIDKLKVLLPAAKARYDHYRRTVCGPRFSDQRPARPPTQNKRTPRNHILTYLRH